MWLSTIPDIGNKKIVQLIRDFGSPVNIWMASEAELRSHQLLNGAIINHIKDKKKRLEAETHLKNLYKNNIKAITINDEKYPPYLKNIYDPPAILYYKGDIKKENKTIAIVGSRRASEYGLKMAGSVSYELGALGMTVVSGMARGVDSYAHYGAIKANGRTIAVLGCGLDTAYPPENKDLMNKIAESGTVISEYLPGTPPLPKNFPARNRIISGLSLGVVIVEANEKSGSLITADFALEQGREVFAVPGNVYSINSRGTNKLIKEGAKIVTCVEDILEELRVFDDGAGPAGKKPNKRENLYKGLDEDEKKIAEQLENASLHIDFISEKTGLSIQAVNSVLVMLEMKGVVEQMPGKIFKIRE